MLWINLLEFFVISLYIFERTLNVKAKSLSIPNIEDSFSWLKQIQLFHHAIEECEKTSTSTASSVTWNCLKLASLQLGQSISVKPIIPLVPGVRLIKKPSTYIDDHHLKQNIDKKFHLNEENLQNITWFERISWNVENMLRSHILELNVNTIAEYFKKLIEQDYRELIFPQTSKLHSLHNEVSGRHRRHRYNMLVTMFFGITAFGAIVVPLGFQLLSLVSGKALLLAKMALLLASINALKWVTNRGTHYGLYHIPGEHYGNVYDREDIHRPSYRQL